MKITHLRYSTLFPTAVLRTPLLPYNKVHSIIANAEALLSTFKNPVLSEALFIASPDLYEQLQQHKVNKNLDTKAYRKLVNALVRYLLRMSFRPTPFGLFAGVSSLQITNQNNADTSFIELFPENYYKRNLTLDMQLVGSILQKLNEQKEIRKHLKYFPNSSIFKMGNQFRYVDFKYEKKYRKYQLSAVDYNEYFQTIFQLSEHGVTIQSLADKLSSNVEERTQTIESIHQLIDAQLLVSESEVSVTGEDTAAKTLQNLKKNGVNHPLIDLLENILHCIHSLNEKGLGIAATEYESIITAIQGTNIPFEKSKLFQADLYKPVSHPHINDRYLKDISKAAKLLSRLNVSSSRTQLDTFIRDFIKRYEDREMPLLQVLDTESGIGFPSNQMHNAIAPLVDDILIQNTNNSYSLELNPIDDFYFSLHQKALKNNLYSIDISEKELTEVSDKESSLPATFSVMSSVVFENEKEYLFVQSAGGTSANQLIARFCHTDENIENLCKSIAQYEQSIYQNAIRAEIIHVPESRLGNILQRSVLSEYEIPYLGKSNLPLENQILVSDLMISISNNEIILRSKKLDKRIIPVLSSAHNFSNYALPVYQFLCSLQLQNVNTSISFSWGAFRDKFQFLPRVTSGNIILSPATWQLKKTDFTLITELKEQEALSEQVRLWRETHKMPRFVAIADGDNELTLDLGNDLCISLLQDELKKRNAVTIVENFINLQKSFVKCKDDLFNHQLVFSFKRSDTKLLPFDFKNSDNVNTKRTFIPGDEWVYYKIYCGSSSSNNILSQVILPVTRLLINQNIIDEWFFIRYADSENHIRVRFKLLVEKGSSDVIARLKFYLKQFLSNGVVSDISINTYNRELERYRFSNVLQAEKLFFYDSKFCLSVLQQNISANDIWKVALWNIYTLLEDFSFTDKQKIEISSAIKNNLSAEHNLISNKTARETINSKYRSHSKDVISILKGNDALINSLVPLFNRRSEKNKQPISDIRNSISENDISDFAGSIIHMSLNRLFLSKQRLQELVAYDFLHRGLVSIIKMT